MKSNNMKRYIKNTFISLEHRDFRIFWFTQCISLMGTFMQRAAQAWLVYSITMSPFKLGMLGVCQFAPIAIFSLFAGVVVDRLPKRKIIIITQIIFMFQALLLSALVFSGNAQYWHILLLAAAFGMVQTFDMPARQSYFIELVGKEHIMNAVSLNSTIANLAKIIGPAVAGFAMVGLGSGFCFLINGVSYLFVITGLFLIKTPDKVIMRKAGRMLEEIKEGLRYINGIKALKIAVVMMAIVCTFAMNIDVIVPVFAKTNLSRGAKEYSFMLSAMGGGSFIGAIFMAGRSKKGIKHNVLFMNAIAVALLQIGAFFCRSYGLILILIGIMGFFNLTFLNMANSMLQLNSSDDYRGRVMSVYSLMNMGSTPLGNFYAGIAMEKYDGAAGFMACGAATLIFTLLALAFRRKRNG